MFAVCVSEPNPDDPVESFIVGKRPEPKSRLVGAGENLIREPWSSRTVHPARNHRPGPFQ